METCRLFTKGPQLLHVHDDPGLVADAQRCADNGWKVDLFKCQRPDLPFTPGDPKLSPPTVTNMIRWW